MSRITRDTKCRLCRAEGIKLYLKGDRCFSGKCPIEKKGAVPPGMHGIKRAKKPTDYGLQLRAKQKLKRIYGVNETQLKNYYLKAKKLKGPVGDNLLILLERRLDNVVYLSGFSSSRNQARQLISHRHLLVNGKKLNISSYQVKLNNLISFNPKTISQFKDNFKFLDKDFKPLPWVSLDSGKSQVKVVGPPRIEDINCIADINLIIEYYSR